MIRPSARRRFSGCLVGGTVALVLALPGCGEPDRAQPDAAAPAPRASANEPDAREVLARLHARVTAGTGLSDAQWGRDVTQLAALLWRVDPTAATQVAATAHVRLTSVAGDVGRDLARSPEERSRWPPNDTVSLEIHDAWLLAAQGGPDGYRAWVEQAGPTLMQRLQETRAKLFDRR